MPQYYLLKEGQEQGPYTIEMLSMHNIDGHTLLRKEGSTEWIKASKIVVLQATISNAATAAAAAVPHTAADAVYPNAAPAKTKKPSKIVLVGIGILLIVIILLFVNHNSFKKREAMYKQQLQALEAKITGYEEIERIRAQQDRQVETARALAENQLKNVAIDNSIKADEAMKKADLVVLKSDYEKATRNLIAEQKKLKDIKRFKVLRSGAEKREQVAEQEAIISNLQNEADRLKRKIDTY